MWNRYRVDKHVNSYRLVCCVVTLNEVNFRNITHVLRHYIWEVDIEYITLFYWIEVFFTFYKIYFLDHTSHIDRKDRWNLWIFHVDSFLCCLGFVGIYTNIGLISLYIVRYTVFNQVHYDIINVRHSHFWVIFNLFCSTDQNSLNHNFNWVFSCYKHHQRYNKDGY